LQPGGPGKTGARADSTPPRRRTGDLLDDNHRRDRVDFDHQIGRGPAFYRLACEHGVEGIVSKRSNGRYEPDRRTWLKIKCLNREEFVVVGRSDPEGSRHRIGSLLLGYHTREGKLIYAGRVGTGMPQAELGRLWQRLQPLAIPKMALAEPPPRESRFGSPLVLSRVHWIRPEMVVEVSYVEWTPDALLRHVVYLGERQDKLAIEVRRRPPHTTSDRQSPVRSTLLNFVSRVCFPRSPRLACSTPLVEGGSTFVEAMG
jgi:ATP-dependent DNA ligase